MKISPAVAVVVIVVVLLIVGLIGWRIMAGRQGSVTVDENAPMDDTSLDSMYEQGGADFTKEQPEQSRDDMMPQNK